MQRRVRSPACSDPNGAGKTTTLRMLYSLLPPDTGTDPHRRPLDPSTRNALEIKRTLGCGSRRPRPLQAPHRAREHRVTTAELHGMVKKALIEVPHPTNWRDTLQHGRLHRPSKTDGFSQGQQVKVAIARAMVHEPADGACSTSPRNGLDVMTTRALRRFILGPQGRPATRSCSRPTSCRRSRRCVTASIIIAEGPHRRRRDAGRTAGAQRRETTSRKPS